MIVRLSINQSEQLHVYVVIYINNCMHVPTWSLEYFNTIIYGTKVFINDSNLCKY